MKQQTFEKLYQKDWDTFTELLESLESLKKSDIPPEQLQEFAQRYRLLCRDLSLAQERIYSSHLLKHLNSLVLRGHQQLYKRQSTSFSGILQFILKDFPALVRQESMLVFLSMALFALPTLIIGSLTVIYPELVYSVLDEEMVRSFESMYDPSLKSLGRERQADSDFAMFGFYIYNNISVSFRTFVSGIVVGLGTIFFLVFNGLFFGALAGHLQTIGYTSTFYSFVVGHASFEITAIVISGAAGLKLGQAILFPGRLSRLSSLKQAAKICVRLIYGVVGMLVLAAYVEAFWSSSTGVSHTIKYLVGALLWTFVICYFLFLGHQRGSESN